MVGFSPQQVQGMRKRGRKHLESLGHRLGASRQNEHEGASNRSREAPGQHRHLRVSQTATPQQLSISRNLAIEQG